MIFETISALRDGAITKNAMSPTRATPTESGSREGREVGEGKTSSHLTRMLAGRRVRLLRRGYATRFLNPAVTVLESFA